MGVDLNLYISSTNYSFHFLPMSRDYDLHEHIRARLDKHGINAMMFATARAENDKASDLEFVIGDYTKTITKDDYDQVVMGLRLDDMVDCLREYESSVGEVEMCPNDQAALVYLEKYSESVHKSHIPVYVWVHFG